MYGPDTRSVSDHFNSFRAETVEKRSYGSVAVGVITVDEFAEIYQTRVARVIHDKASGLSIPPCRLVVWIMRLS